ncbi:MAG: 4-alpha-glucanotransferase [Myxococcota bacterium]
MAANRPRLRHAGVLLHPTSLPSAHGIGDLGDGARRFLDWLAEAGLTRWQVLPLVPTGGGNSPYGTPAALAGHPLLVDLVELGRWGLLSADALQAPAFGLDSVDFARVIPYKRERLIAAADALIAGKNPGLKQELDEFRQGARWAEDAAAFLALKAARNGEPWWSWEPALRDREPAALAAAKAAVQRDIDREVALFFFFERQWRSLRSYAKERGVAIIGDVPIYVDRDSADVWAARESFRLNPDGSPVAVAGVPPDFFSKDGQLWGNPLYDWARMAQDGHRWWVERMRRALTHVDIVRLDHFRGFAAYWEVAADATNARGGKWVPGPGRALFDDLRRELGDLPLIAEDLGKIDDAVHELRDTFDLPGMKILQFAFDEDDDHPFLPHRHTARSVCYTATHDNDTTLGWWQTTNERARDHVRRYLAVSGHEVVWDLIRACFASVADLAIVPLQDVLCLDGRSRMNTPGVAEGNWGWRVRVQAFNHPLAARLKELAELYGRGVTTRKKDLAPD